MFCVLFLRLFSFLGVSFFFSLSSNHLSNIWRIRECAAIPMCFFSFFIFFGFKFEQRKKKTTTKYVNIFTSSTPAAPTTMIFQRNCNNNFIFCLFEGNSFQVIIKRVWTSLARCSFIRLGKSLSKYTIYLFFIFFSFFFIQYGFVCDSVWNMYKIEFAIIIIATSKY